MTRVFSSCGEILVCLWADSRRVAVFSVCPQLVQRAPTDSLPNRAIDLQFAGKWQSCDPRLPGPVWTLLPSWLGYRSPDSGQNGMRSETRTNRCAFVHSHSRFRIVPPPPSRPMLAVVPAPFPFSCRDTKRGSWQVRAISQHPVVPPGRTSPLPPRVWE